MVPEDRKRDGLLLLQTIRHNLNLPYLSLGGGWLLSRSAEAARAGAMSERLAIRSSGVEQRAVNLSGGNQQKVVLGKWLINEPGILLLDDPTRGIDVGAKAGIYQLIDDLTARRPGHRPGVQRAARAAGARRPRHRPPRR